MDKCICQGSLVYGVKSSRLSFYLLLISTGRLDELTTAIMNDMEKCPLHFLESGMFPESIKEEYRQKMLSKPSST